MHKYLLLAITFLFANVFAQTVSNQKKIFTKTINNISVVNHEEQTNWEFQITPITQQDLQYFINQDGEKIPVNQFIKINNNNTTFIAVGNGNFDLLYSVTAISDYMEPTNRGKAQCIFLLSPFDVSVSNIYSANCSYTNADGINVLTLNIK